MTAPEVERGDGVIGVGARGGGASGGDVRPGQGCSHFKNKVFRILLGIGNGNWK